MAESKRAKQLAFNGVWRGLKSQGFKQSKLGELCKYRGKGGACCAAGWLIKDENYSGDLEGLSSCEPDVVRALKPTFAQFGEGVPVRFITASQRCHDGDLHNDYTVSPQQMEKTLRALAEKHELTIPED